MNEDKTPVSETVIPAEEVNEPAKEMVAPIENIITTSPDVSTTKTTMGSRFSKIKLSKTTAIVSSIVALVIIVLIIGIALIVNSTRKGPETTLAPGEQLARNLDQYVDLLLKLDGMTTAQLKSLKLDDLKPIPSNVDRFTVTADEKVVIDLSDIPYTNENIITALDSLDLSQKDTYLDIYTLLKGKVITMEGSSKIQADLSKIDNPKADLTYKLSINGSGVSFDGELLVKVLGDKVLFNTNKISENIPLGTDLLNILEGKWYYFNISELSNAINSYQQQLLSLTPSYGLPSTYKLKPTLTPTPFVRQSYAAEITKLKEALRIEQIQKNTTVLSDEQQDGMTLKCYQIKMNGADTNKAISAVRNLYNDKTSAIGLADETIENFTTKLCFDKDSDMLYKAEYILSIKLPIPASGKTEYIHMDYDYKFNISGLGVNLILLDPAESEHVRDLTTKIQQIVSPSPRVIY